MADVTPSSEPVLDGPLAADGFAWAIVELAPDGILVADDDGLVLMANRRVEELFGYGRGELEGSLVERLLPLRFRDAHVAERDRYRERPATRSMGAGLELSGCRADGSEFPVEVALSPVATDRGMAIVVVIRDVTDQRANERAARAKLVLDEYERIATEMQDRVINHLFASGLTLASVLGRNQVDAATADRLHEVIEELDTATRELRLTVFARLARTPPIDPA